MRPGSQTQLVFAILSSLTHQLCQTLIELDWICYWIFIQRFETNCGHYPLLLLKVQREFSLRIISWNLKMNLICTTFEYHKSKIWLIFAWISLKRSNPDILRRESPGGFASDFLRTIQIWYLYLGFGIFLSSIRTLDIVLGVAIFGFFLLGDLLGAVN